MRLWFLSKATQHHSESVRTTMRELMIDTKVSPLYPSETDPPSRVIARTDVASAQSIIDKYSRPFHEFVCCAEDPAASDAILNGLFDYYMNQLFGIEWTKHYTCSDRRCEHAHRRLVAYMDDRMKEPPPMVLFLDGYTYVLTRGPDRGRLGRCTRHASFLHGMVEWARIVTIERSGKLTLGKNVGQILTAMVSTPPGRWTAEEDMETRLLDVS